MFVYKINLQICTPIHVQLIVWELIIHLKIIILAVVWSDARNNRIYMVILTIRVYPIVLLDGSLKM